MEKAFIGEISRAEEWSESRFSQDRVAFYSIDVQSGVSNGCVRIPEPHSGVTRRATRSSFALPQLGLVVIAGYEFGPVTGTPEESECEKREFVENVVWTFDGTTVEEIFREDGCIEGNFFSTLDISPLSNNGILIGGPSTLIRRIEATGEVTWQRDLEENLTGTCHPRAKISSTSRLFDSRLTVSKSFIPEGSDFVERLDYLVEGGALGSASEMSVSPSSLIHIGEWNVEVIYDGFLFRTSCDGSLRCMSPLRNIRGGAVCASSDGLRLIRDETPSSSELIPTQAQGLSRLVSAGTYVGDHIFGVQQQPEDASFIITSLNSKTGALNSLALPGVSSFPEQPPFAVENGLVVLFADRLVRIDMPGLSGKYDTAFPRGSVGGNTSAGIVVSIP